MASSFTTGGSTSTRYTLNSIVIDVQTDADEARVSLYTESSSVPGRRVGIPLTQSGSADSGNLTFNASGITLNGASTYWVVVEGIAGDGPEVDDTRSGAEDTSSTSGWSIGNIIAFRSSGSGTWALNVHSYGPFLFRVNATVLQPETQPVVALVENLQHSGGTVNVTDQRATAIRTGPSRLGYTLTSIDLTYRDIAGNETKNSEVRILTDNNGRPGVELAELTAPGNYRGVRSWTAPEGTILDPDTFYWVTVNEGVSSPIAEYVVINENRQRGLRDFTIADEGFRKTSGNWAASPNTQHSLKMAIKGYRVSTTTKTYRLTSKGQGGEPNTADGTVNSSTPLWMSFTTGGAITDISIFHHVGIDVASGAQNLEVEIWSSDGANPGAQIGKDLSLADWESRSGRDDSASPAQADLIFYPAADDEIVLEGGATYWFRFANKLTHAHPTLRRTTADRQGGPAGWFLGDNVVKAQGSGYTQEWSESVILTVVATEPPQGSRQGLVIQVNLSADTVCGSDGTTGTDCPPDPNTPGARVVREGNAIKVTASLNRAFSADNSTVINAVVQADTAEPGDYGSLTGFSMTIPAGQKTASYDLQTYHDTDDIDESFRVQLGDLPSGVSSGPDHSLYVIILDDDNPQPLAAPGNVTARAGPGSGEATFSWDAVSGATTYHHQHVMHNGSCSRAAWPSGWQFSSATTLKIGGLTNGGSYCFRVRAARTTGDTTGTPSLPVSVRPRDTGYQLFPVENISVTHNGTSLTVSWDALAGAMGYDVTYRNNTTGVNARAAWNHTTTSLTITCDSRTGFENQNCVTGNASYTVGVRARNASGFGPWSDQSVAAVAASSVPDAVSNISVTHNGTSLTVTWTAPAGATHYDVTYYRHDTGVNARGAWNRAGTSLTITCDSRYPGQNRDCVVASATYTVGIRARNAHGVSEWTNSAPASTGSGQGNLGVADADAHVPGPLGGVRHLRFAVTLDAALEREVAVDYATREGTALESGDYEPGVFGTLWFRPGETSKTVQVLVAQDASVQSCETMLLELSNPRGAEIADGLGVGFIHDGPPEAGTAWLFPSASDPARRGVVRVVNRSAFPGTVSVTATDDAGRTYPALALELEAGGERVFDSRDLEAGNPSIGLTGATGPGAGDWRLAFASATLDVQVLPYIHAAGPRREGVPASIHAAGPRREGVPPSIAPQGALSDGFVAPMDATAPANAQGVLQVPVFSPADDFEARSLLRLVNPSAVAARVAVSAIDDAGRSPSAPVLLALPPSAACTVDAAQLESGTGLPCGLHQPGLGNGTGSWRAWQWPQPPPWSQ